MTQASSLTTDALCLMVREELEERGVPVAMRMVIDRERYASAHRMRIGPVTVSGVRLPTQDEAAAAAPRLADQAQIALRHIKVMLEAGRWLRALGRPTLGAVQTPAWGLACHPFALALLEPHGHDGEWLRNPAVTGRRAVRTVECDLSTLTIHNMAATAQRASTGGYMAPIFSFATRQTTTDADRSTMNLGTTLPETIVNELTGRRLADIVETPPMRERVAAAMTAVRVTTVKQHPKTTMLTLEPADWICAAPLPDDVDPACLSIPLPRA